MAETTVETKKRGIPCLGWLFIGIAVLVIILLLMRSCNNDNYAINTADTGAAVGATAPNTTTNDTTVAGRTPGADDWDDIEKNSQNASYAEVTNKNISVRGNDNYGVYSLGNDILFDLNKSTLRKGADQNL